MVLMMIFLKNIADRQIPHLGVDASGNVNEIAKTKGVSTLSKRSSAKDIVTNHGKADIIFSSIFIILKI